MDSNSYKTIQFTTGGDNPGSFFLIVPLEDFQILQLEGTDQQSFAVIADNIERIFTGTPVTFSVVPGQTVELEDGDYPNW